MQKYLWYNNKLVNECEQKTIQEAKTAFEKIKPPLEDRG